MLVLCLIQCANLEANFTISGVMKDTGHETSIIKVMCVTHYFDKQLIGEVSMESCQSNTHYSVDVFKYNLKTLLTFHHNVSRLLLIFLLII